MIFAGTHVYCFVAADAMNRVPTAHLQVTTELRIEH